MRIPSFLLTLIIMAFSAVLTGCPMVGPDFQKPAAPTTERYVQLPSPTQTVSSPLAGTAGYAQRFNYGQDIPAEWWTLFHSESLNELIQAGLKNSPNLAAAKATLRQAAETLRAELGSLYPAVSANLSAERMQLSGASQGTNSSSTFNLYNANVSVSYIFDVFGGVRRQIESLAAQMDYQSFELEAAYLSLTSNITTTVINIASLQAQIQATHELIKAEEEQLIIIKRQLGLGGVSGTNVLTQETQVAQTRALLPPLEQNLAQSRHALAVLVGEFPSQMKLPYFDLNKLRLPGQLPVSLPSSLVRQRPDIRASEALLKSASAQVGVATANLYPQITLTAAYGWSGLTLDGLFSPSNVAWNLGPQLVQPIFQGGSLQATRRASIAAFEAAQAQYRQTVLQAFQNVADTLRALQNDARTLQAQSQAELAAKNTMIITQKQLGLGGVSYLNLLTAEQQYQQTKISRIQAEAARYADTAALFQALGGGWWNRQVLPPPTKQNVQEKKVKQSKVK